MWGYFWRGFLGDLHSLTQAIFGPGSFFIARCTNLSAYRIGRVLVTSRTNPFHHLLKCLHCLLPNRKGHVEVTAVKIRYRIRPKVYGHPNITRQRLVEEVTLLEVRVKSLSADPVSSSYMLWSCDLVMSSQPRPLQQNSFNKDRIKKNMRCTW